MKASETHTASHTTPAATRKKSATSVLDKYDWGDLEYDEDTLRGAPMPCQFTDEEFSQVIKESLASGYASDEEVKAFFSQWGL